MGTDSNIWKICKEVAPIVIEYLSCNSGKKAHINIWKDNIPLEGPLTDRDEISDLENWMQQEGYIKLKYISK